jgi:hypothetical protein
MAHATMAAASALASGNFTSHLSRPHAAGDSRLLTNLIKSERSYINNLHASVMSAHAAASALSAWGTSEAPDVTECSARLADLLSASADVQNTHVSAIEGYRAALKDVSDREASIRAVVRDRDILVGRLIKASNKSISTSGKNSKKSPEEKAEKVHIAQRELHACENILTQEEAALVGVKRRTFKEALTMRMKTMGDAGAAMVDAAKEAILLLDQFDSNDYQRPQTPHYDEYGNIAQEDVYSDPQQQQYPQQYPQQYAQPYPQQYSQQSQAQEEPNGERSALNHPNFDVSSVTPSQSASQIYQPQFANRNSAAYNAPFRGIGEHEGEGPRQSNRQMQRQQGEDSDSDDEEDWKRSFAQDSTTPHQGMPAPHQISVDAGAHRSFMPYVVPAPPPPTPKAPKEADRQSNAPSRAPSVQSKRKSKTAERYEQFGPPTTVAMPPIPTARRLQADGVYMEPVPTAPKLYMPGASGDQADSSVGSYEERAGGKYAKQMASGDGASSDGERTARQSSSRPGAKRSSSFFGKMSRLFKTDVKGDTKERSGRARSGSDSIQHTQWNTRTDALVRDSQRSAGPLPPSSVSRKQNMLNKPTAEPDSSDEEPIDESKAIRVTNPKRPLWQGDKKGLSEAESRKLIENSLIRPPVVKRTPSITPGPASSKSHQATTTAAAPQLLRSNSVTNSVTPSAKKKKRKSKAPSLAGGSEIGTDSTRTRVLASDFNRQPHHTSVIVAGDASAGVRHSESLNYAESTKSSKKTKKKSSTVGQLSSIGPNDRESKFSTSNWVAKSNLDTVNRPEPAIALAAATAPAPVTASAPAPAPPAALPASPKRQSTTNAAPLPPSKLNQSHTETYDTTTSEESKPKHIPQPSATMSPPLKPSLKIPGAADLARSGSTASSAAGYTLPSLPPPVSAPPPVTSLNLDDHFVPAQPVNSPSEMAKERMSIDVDNRFDGTGKLGVSEYQAESSPEKEKRNEPKSKPVALPKIDMPASEPFRIDYDAKDGAKSGGSTGREGSNANNVLTPGESEIYQSYMMQQADASPALAQAQPSGVTRFSDRIASVGRGVLGLKSSPPRKSTKASAAASPSAAGVATTDTAQATSPQSPTLPVPPPGQLSRTYSDQNVAQSSDSSDDEELPTQMVTPTAPPPVAAPPPIMTSSPYPSAMLPGSTNGVNAQRTETAPSSVDGGSTLGRRKSVRMAPDVKLPPESPALESFPGKDAKFDYSTPGSQLSSRIAPPPQAPPRISANDVRGGSIDLGAGSREVQGWSIRAAPLDDSSEEEEGSEYLQARKQFGSASKSWGRKVKKGNAVAAPAAVEGGSIKKKKKKSASSSNSGYNPAIALPKGMEVVGRSNSVRR